MDVPEYEEIDDSFNQVVLENDTLDEYNNIYSNKIGLEDIILIYFKNDIKYIGNAIEIDLINNKIIISNDKENIILNTDELGNIIIKTEIYEIIDIEKVIKFDEKQEDELFEKTITEQLKKDIYPEIEFKTKYKNIKNYKYTNYEKREILLSSIVDGLNIYDDNEKVQEVSQSLDILLSTKEYENNNYINKYENIPNWLRPIANNYKKIYTNLVDDYHVDDPNILVNQNKEISKIYDINVNSNDYFDFIKKLYQSQFDPTQINNFENGTIDKYEGDYLMNRNNFGIDNRKTRNEIKYQDKDGVYNIVVDKENIDFDKFILFPNKYTNLNYKFDITDKTLSLNQKILYSNIIHSQNYSSNLDKAFKDGIIFNDLNQDIMEYDNNKINIYSINGNISKDELIEKIKDKLPQIKDILEDINIPIYNYIDINKILYQYNILFTDINIEDKLYINNLLDKYNRNFKDYKFNKIISNKKDNPEISKIEITKNIKKFILKQTNINIRNLYLNKFIENFTKPGENKNWLYSIYSDEKILCKHHKIAILITEQEDAFTKLINNWGGNPIDGSVYCKCCNEYLAPEDFNLLEGFDGDKPMKTNEVIEKKEIDIFENLSESQKNDIKLIKLLSINIGINLIDIDIIDILELFKLIDNKLLCDKRYDTYDIINKNYPSIKNAKNTSKDKLKKIKNSVRLYLIDSNKIIFYFCCILIKIQINIPGYKNISDDKEILNMKNKHFLKFIAESNNEFINKSGVSLILNKIKLISKKLNKQKIWKHSQIFINEYNNPELIKPEYQIINCIKYIVSPSFNNIVKNIRNYYINNIRSDINYIKNYWKTYKPLPDNILVKQINDKLNTEDISKKNKKYYLKYDIINYSFENVSYLYDINYNNYIYNKFDIDISDILDNQSFNKLYEYSIYLYGKHKNSDYINLLINRFINTIDQKNKINVLSIFKSYGWNDQSLSFKTKNIDFKNLKKCMIDVINYYKTYNKIDIEINDHITFNNVILPFINFKPKRLYNTNKNPLFKNINNDLLMDKFKKKYCYDKNGNIIINDSKVEHYISIDFDFNKIISDCDSIITEQKIKSILDKIYLSNIIKPIYFNIAINNIKYESRIVEFINSNQLMKSDENILKLYDISNGIINETGETGTDYSDVYTNIKSDTINFIDDIIQFTSQYEKLDYVLELNNENINIFGKDFINIKNLIYPPEPGDNLYNSSNPYIGISNHELMYFNDYIFSTTSMIVNKKQTIHKIPGWWNMNQYNKELYSEFLNKNNLVIHNDVFINIKNKNSFEKYYEYNYYFYNFLKYIRNFGNDSELIVGKSNSLFSEERAERLQKYNFILLIHKMTEYIGSLEDIDSSLYNQLYLYLEQHNLDINIDHAIEVLKNFVIEILINILQEYNDPTWIITMNNNLLKEQISIQKEREKLELTGKLDKMSADQRYVYVKKQSIGAVNWYKNASDAAEKYITSEEYSKSTIQQRQEYLNNLYNQYKETTEEVLKTESLVPQSESISNTPLEQVDEQEEGYYDENDIDNEGEGEEYMTMNLDDD